MNQNRDRGTLKEFLSGAGTNIDPAVTAWCAAMVNATLAKMGIKGTGSDGARSFLEWGEKVDKPEIGDIVVFSRGDPNGWRGHVGFYEGENPDGTLKILGGNQSKSVKSSNYSKDRVLGYRRAPGMSAPGTAAVAGSSASSSVMPQRIAIDTADQLGSRFNDKAMEQFMLFLVEFPQAMNQAMGEALNRGDTDAVAEMMRSAGGGAFADKFVDLNAINMQTQAAVASVEAATELKSAIEGMSFSWDDVKTPGLTQKSVDRETAALIKKLTEGGADLKTFTGTSSDAEAEAHIRAMVAAKARSEAERELADIQSEMVETSATQRREAEERISLQEIEDRLGERARAREEIRLRLLNEDADSGVSRSEADRKKIEDLEMTAWDAENAKRLAEEAKTKAEKDRDEAEKVHTDKIAAANSKIALLNDQLADAVESGDRGLQSDLKDQLGETYDAVKLLNDEYIKFLETAGGPGSQKAILDAQRFGLEIDRNKAKMGEMTPEVKAIGDVIETNMNGVIDSFFQLRQENVSTWDAIKQSVSRAMGQIIIDIGRMITQAIIADATMKALNMATGTTPTGGGMPGGGGGSASGIFQAIGSIFGGMGGGKFHDGGIIGDPSKSINFFKELANLKPGERPIIAEDGEEMLTRKDPRHRANMGLSIARMTRFHTGGIMGKLPDTLGAKLGASGAGGILGKAFSSIVDGGKPALAAANPIYHIHNHFKAKDMMDQALSTPAGERMILNVVAKNKSKLGF